MSYPIITEANAACVGQSRFEADASELGLAPGDFPVSFGTGLGNRMSFVRCAINTHEGELLSVMYRQTAGSITLTIWND